MKIGGIVENNNLTLYRMISLKDQPGSAGSILKIFAQNNINIEYITESSTSGDLAVMAICVKSDKSEKLDSLLSEQELMYNKLNIIKIEQVSVLGIYGPHFREKPFLAAKFCMILGLADVNILGLSSSISSISSVIKSEEVPVAKEALLKEFDLP
jgi:aspartokinase